MKRVTVAPFQSVFDIAIQVYGVADGVEHLVVDNGLEDWEVYPGQELHLRSELTGHRIAKWHRATGWTPVSDFRDSEGPDFNFDFNHDFNN